MQFAVPNSPGAVERALERDAAHTLAAADKELNQVPVAAFGAPTVTADRLWLPL